MASYPEGPALPEYLHRGRWGLVRGIVRSPSGQPVAGCAVGANPTTVPTHCVPDMAAETAADGSYQLGLPAATYTIKAHRRGVSSGPSYGEAAGVVVAVGHTVIADITIGEREYPPHMAAGPEARNCA
jgi:hypothetical protein